MGRNAPTEEKRKQDDATLQIIFDYVQWRIQGGGVTGVITPPPLVAEIFLCSNSNFSPTGAIPPLSGAPLAFTPPPPSENPVSAPDVVNNVYPEHACKNQKANIRKQSKSYFAKSGQLYYRHQRGQHHENSQLFSYVGWGSPIQTFLRLLVINMSLCKKWGGGKITFSQFSEGTGHNSSKNNRNA